MDVRRRWVERRVLADVVAVQALAIDVVSAGEAVARGRQHRRFEVVGIGEEGRLHHLLDQRASFFGQGISAAIVPPRLAMRAKRAIEGVGFDRHRHLAANLRDRAFDDEAG